MSFDITFLISSIMNFYEEETNLSLYKELFYYFIDILIDKNGDEFGRVIGEVDFVSEEFINLIKKYLR